MIKVLSRGRTAASHYKTVKANPEYFGEFVRSLYKSDNMLTQEEIAQNPSRFFIKSSFVQLLKDKLKVESVSVIYSMWLGYLDADRIGSSYSYLPKIKHDPEIKLIPIHTSGHAVLDDLKKMVSAIKPKIIIPIHTEHGEKYEDHFSSVLRLEDGEKHQI